MSSTKRHCHRLSKLPCTRCLPRVPYLSHARTLSRLYCSGCGSSSDSVSVGYFSFSFSSLRVGGLWFRETIVGTMGTVKRRGGNTRPAGVETRRGELEVVGFRCRFFDDDAMADFVNSGHGLQSWNGDENNLMVDRFDVRHLLSDASVLRRRRSRAPSPDVSDQELDFERYRDLEEAAADGVLDNSLLDEGMIPFLHFVCCLWIFFTLYRVLFWCCKPW